MAQQTEQRIDVREAIAKARAYIKYLYADENIERLMLEGVELSEDEKNWVITFGFDMPTSIRLAHMSDRFPGTTQEYERTYRDILVGALTGEVVSMRPRIIWKIS